MDTQECRPSGDLGYPLPWLSSDEYITWKWMAWVPWKTTFLHTPFQTGGFALPCCVCRSVTCVVIVLFFGVGDVEVSDVPMHSTRNDKVQESRNLGSLDSRMIQNLFGSKVQESLEEALCETTLSRSFLRQGWTWTRRRSYDQQTPHAPGLRNIAGGRSFVRHQE